MSIKVTLVLLLSGVLSWGCSSPDDDEGPSEAISEITDATPEFKSPTIVSEITPGEVLGENCFDDHSCYWEQLPSPSYPSVTGVGEASCDVWLTVGEDGRAQDVSVDCDDPRFNRATEIGLSTLKHRVKDSCGRPCSMIGRRIQYPIEYRFED